RPDRARSPSTARDRRLARNRDGQRQFPKNAAAARPARQRSTPSAALWQPKPSFRPDRHLESPSASSASSRFRSSGSSGTASADIAAAALRRPRRYSSTPMAPSSRIPAGPYQRIQVEGFTGGLSSTKSP